MEIVKIVIRSKTNHVVITGGEPTIQPIGELIDALHKYDKYVQIETNGTSPVIHEGDVYARPDWITCSPKTDISISANEWKFVVQKGIDLPLKLIQRIE